MTNPNLSLPELIRLRDTKRDTLSNLFEQKKEIMNRMKTLMEELSKIDDDIEVMEDQNDQRRRLQMMAPQIKSEPGISDTNSNTNETSPMRSSLPLTMNPDEILTEPTQTTPTRDQCDDEHLTDPLTSTQAETGTDEQFYASKSASVIRQEQGGQRSIPLDNDDINDYYYDSGDDHASGPPINNSRIIIEKSTKLSPHQSETTFEPQLETSNHKRGPGTIDSFRTFRNVQQPQTMSSNFASSCPYSQHDIYETLRQSFRLQTFRENQFEIIQSTLSGRDNFVLMKTGGGKSLLYQLPAVLESPKITLVVSPLLSLIQDQEEQMNNFVRNSCVSFTSGIGQSQHNENWKRVRDVTGGIMMILVTPERVFKSNKLRSELENLDQQNRLGRFVIDECHCACQVRGKS